VNNPVIFTIIIIIIVVVVVIVVDVVVLFPFVQSFSVHRHHIGKNRRKL